MNKEGAIIEEHKLFGYKVTHKILRLDMILCVGEVKLDTSQKGDSVVSGEMIVCAAGRKFSTNSKR